MRTARKLLLVSAALIAMLGQSVASAAPRSGDATAHRLVAGLEGGSGSTIGPDGALYVTESAAGARPAGSLRAHPRRRTPAPW